MDQVVDRSLIFLGPGAVIDDHVIVGYRSPRKIPTERLVIGEGARLRTGTVVYCGSTIGKRLETGHGVVIREENVIGDNFRIWANSVIDYGCTIGPGVTIHCNCYVAQYTEIGEGAFLAPGVTIANDYHPGCERSAECMRGPSIGARARIGVNATLLPYVSIGEGSLVGSGAVVTKDVPPGAVVYGNPARVAARTADLVCKTGLVERPYPDET